MATTVKASAFRSGTDIDELGDTPRVVYGLPPLRLALVPDLPTAIPQTQAEKAALLAAKTWLTPACAAPAISFEGTTLVAAAPGDGLSTIQWVGDWKARNLPENAAATTDVQYVRAPSGEWTIAEADIYLNADMEWTAADELPLESGGQDEPRDLRAVLTHEFGHALGLLHPCESGKVDGAPACDDEHIGICMHPVYSPSQRNLAADDVDGLCYLYPAASCEEECAEGFACTSSGCQLLCGSSVCAEHEACLLGECVKRDDCADSSCSGSTCTTDADCTSGQFCSSGSCRGTSARGDPCAAAIDCADGACRDGACAVSCSATVSCSNQAVCDTESGACIDELHALGDACDSADDCAGEYCLQENRDRPVCTRRCSGEDAACPRDWTCERVESEHVCVPQRLMLAGGSSCNVSARHLDSSRQRSEIVLLGAGFGAALALARLRRSRRDRRDHCLRHGIPS